MFGGGAKYSCGEDSIFIHDCIKNGLKVYVSPAKICSVSQEKSTWFKGYNEKFFFDKGVLVKAIFGKLAYFYVRFYIAKNHHVICHKIPKKQAVSIMLSGVRSWKKA